MPREISTSYMLFSMCKWNLTVLSQQAPCARGLPLIVCTGGSVHAHRDHHYAILGPTWDRLCSFLTSLWSVSIVLSLMWTDVAQ